MKENASGCFFLNTAVYKSNAFVVHCMTCGVKYSLWTEMIQRLGRWNGLFANHDFDVNLNFVPNNKASHSIPVRHVANVISINKH